MWSPTHIQLTGGVINGGFLVVLWNVTRLLLVGRCKNLVKKGKPGTNDAYVLIKCGTSKFQTSVKERTVEPQWYEKCEFALKDDPKLIKVKVYHRNFLGSDTLLGFVTLSLDQIELPISQQKKDWYRLKQKDSLKNLKRCFGEIELILSLEVQSFLSTSRPELKKDLPQPIKSAAKSIGSMLRLKSYTSDSTSNGDRSDIFLRSKSYMDVSEMRYKDITDSHDKMAFQIEEEEVEEEGSLPLSFDSDVKTQVELGENECVDGKSEIAERQEHNTKPAQSEVEIEKFWETLENSPLFGAKKENIISTAKSQHAKNSGSHQHFFDSLLDEATQESKSTQTSLDDVAKMATTSSQTSNDEMCLKCEEKCTEKEDYFSQKQELLKLLNRQKNDIRSNEKRIKELEEYIDNMLARILETQPQLLSSGVLVFNSVENKKSASTEGFVSKANVTERNEVPLSKKCP